MKTTPRLHLLSVAASVLALAISAAPTGYGATQAQIDQAITNGLAWLATQQQPNGSFGSGANPLAYTAAAVLAFENEGYLPGGGTPYSTRVERGLDYILTNARSIAIGPQPAGDPDSNGNGIGICWWDESYGREVYETGMIMQTLVASSTPDRLVTVGAFAGLTYRQVMQEVVDWAAFGQTDSGTYRGGWRYYANQGLSDNSTAQWPVLGLVAAEQWGIFAPPFVKNELRIWTNYIQNANGGSGYDSPGNMVNESKTGGLLVQMHYLGDDATAPRAQAALGYLNNTWNSPLNFWDGNRGHPYAMFSIFKGLELMEVTTIPNAPATPDTPVGDWYGNYTDFLVNSQNANGSWNGYFDWNTWLSTAWYVVILQATIFPVEVAIDLPDCACDSGYQFEVSYSVERFPATGILTLFEDGVAMMVFPITGFQGSAAQQIDVNSDTPGPHEWKAVLAVTAAGGVSASAEDADTVNVCETPQVSGIPDQVAPFQTFDLDDYLTYGGVLPVVWTTAGAPPDWSVTMDGDNVVTVVAPVGASDPVDITFTASVVCCSELVCSSSDVANFEPNQSPDCSAAFASIELIWPPNNKLVPIQVLGVTDPDGDQLTITIDAIRQDEPVNTLGDGNFAPDGGGLGTDIAWVRAERSATKKVAGNGRVYHISFTADDGRGGFCSGKVRVGVPHDVKAIPVDDGAVFDSTALAP